MPAISLKIDQLDLDLRNPRSTPSSSQREALQKIVTEQDAKLAELAESIVEEGTLNPMERMLALQTGSGKTARYTVLEGNRRTAALKILSNPTVLGGLEVKQGVKRRLEAAAKSFDKKAIEPIDAFLIDRDEAEYWLRLRHTGENAGRGVVDWSSQQQARFVGASPPLQAVDFVREHGALSDDEKHALQGRFITTVKRLLESPDVRDRIGVELQGSKLLTPLPADQVMKPLKRIVLDLALSKVTVTSLKSVKQMTDYVDDFPPEDLPDFTFKGELIELGDVFARRPTKPSTGGGGTGSGGSGSGSGSGAGGTGGATGGGTGKGGTGGTGGGRSSDPSKRLQIVPKGLRLNVTDSRIAAIYNELKKLKLKESPNAISVLFRVFIELSVDHYMSQNGLPTFVQKGAKKHFKSFQDKIKETIQHMVDHKGADSKIFIPLQSSIHDDKSPLYYELLHSYVHNRFSPPDADKLKAGWDKATPLLAQAWA